MRSVIYRDMKISIMHVHVHVPCNPTIVLSPEFSPPTTPTSVAEFPLSSRESRLSLEEITLVGEMRENRVC